ncbi:unnamed protein product [Dicrocoelium dendriticum]|nr:unnamed protein product [Dicrocoelium dendriticum]
MNQRTSAFFAASNAVFVYAAEILVAEISWPRNTGRYVTLHHCTYRLSDSSMAKEYTSYCYPYHKLLTKT